MSWSRYKTTLLTSLGATLEYYDFVIYAMLASHLSTLYFPNEDKITSLLETFAVFAIGYLVRPLGGILFGSRSDRLGRKSTFLITLYLMAFSTFAIGLIPTYASWGLASSLLLVALRIVQGIAYGAEMPGAITFLSEHSHSSKRGLHSSLMLVGIGLGTLFASSLITLLTQILSTEQMLSFGWRIPFIIGGSLAIIGAILRRQIEETPLFQSNKTIATPLRTLLWQYPKKLIQGIGITLFAACFILFYLYIPAYLHQSFAYPLKSIYPAITIGLLWSAICLPLFGYLSDYLGRTRQLIIGTIVVLFGCYGLFYLASLGHFAFLLSFAILYQTMVAWLAACYPSMLAELFPTTVRHSGVAFCYNIAYAFAGLAPLLANFLIKLTEEPMAVTFIIILTGLLSLVALLTHRDRTGSELG